MKFLDQAKIYVKAGDGGNGIASFRREKFIEFGGPNGGDGGKGGSVILKAVNGLNTLIDFRFTQRFISPNGEKGGSSNKTGHNGKNIYLKIPLGTQVYAEDKKTLIHDFTKENEEFILAKGGNGGIGNTKFKSSTNRAPRKFTSGKLGEEISVWLELKIIADIGLIGFPNVGKSSFLNISTKARPKIANYPFTTLNPNLGVIQFDDKEIIVADIPGIIKGAHKGIGLGDKFLKHIERCKSLLHIIDINEDNLIEKYMIIRKELKLYSENLIKKKEIVVFNKTDLLDDNEKNKKIKEFKKFYKKKIFSISIYKNENIKEILRIL